MNGKSNNASKCLAPEHHRAECECGLRPLLLAKCEACGVNCGEKHIYVRLMNGGLRLCPQCLAEFNGKNPELATLRAALDKALAFKAYVHARLDAAGVTVDPESPHKVEGCRVGGRLDEVLGERDKLRAKNAELREALLPLANLAEANPAIADNVLIAVRVRHSHAEPYLLNQEPTVGDCRRAAELLANKEEQPK